jgi:regulator of sigma E protease
MNVVYFCAFIAVNLAFMNMLPIPALDGGHIFLLLVTWVIESITKKKIDPKYEAYIHGAGLVVLLAFMVLVTFNDIVKLITG